MLLLTNPPSDLPGSPLHKAGAGLTHWPPSPSSLRPTARLIPVHQPVERPCSVQPLSPPHPTPAPTPIPLLSRLPHWPVLSLTLPNTSFFFIWGEFLPCTYFQKHFKHQSRVIVYLYVLFLSIVSFLWVRYKPFAAGPWWQTLNRYLLGQPNEPSLPLFGTCSRDPGTPPSLLCVRGFSAFFC